MKKRYIHIVGLCFSVLSGWSVYAQRPSDEYFQNFEFRKYIQTEDVNSSDEAVILQLAQSHYYLHQYQEASNFFAKIDWLEVDVDPVNQLFYANSLKNTGKIQEAKTIVINYIKAYPEDKDAKILLSQIENAGVLGGLKDEKISLSLLKNLNNGAAQFGIIWKDGELYFISESVQTSPKQVQLNYDVKSDDLAYGLNVRPHAQLMKLSENNSTLVKSLEGFNIGASDYESSSKTWFLTLTPKVKKWSNFPEPIPSIYTFKEGEKSPKKLKIKGIKEGQGYGQPTLSKDGNTMIFVLDKGKTGSDLYISRKENNQWQKLTSLEAINTYKDEVFPMLVGDSLLFFASDGQNGFGGLDIYKVKLQNMDLTGGIEILPQPINSVGDDYAIVYKNENMNAGWISSDREGGMGDADLYYFEKMLPWKLNLIVKNDLGKTPENLKIFKTKDNNKSNFKVASSGQSETTELAQNDKITFEIIAEDTTIFVDFLTPSSNGKDSSIIVSIPTKKIKPIEVAEVKKEVKTESKFSEKDDLNSIYFAFDKSNISEPEIQKLKVLIKQLKEQPDRYVVVRTFADERGDVLYNLDLTTKRAKSVYAYLVKNGISPNKIKLQSMGEAEYVENCGENCEEAVHSRYRRADFEIK
jgi:outer membrane protein OmpA-like peptidoglycan-associated protein